MFGNNKNRIECPTLAQGRIRSVLFYEGRRRNGLEGFTNCYERVTTMRNEHAAQASVNATCLRCVLKQLDMELQPQFHPLAQACRYLALYHPAHFLGMIARAEMRADDHLVAKAVGALHEIVQV